MWCFLGFGDTFDFFECIRETDTTERFLSLAERQMFVYQRQIYQTGAIAGVKHFYLTAKNIP